jgi:hypothetical protein
MIITLDEAPISTYPVGFLYTSLSLPDAYAPNLKAALALGDLSLLDKTGQLYDDSLM